MHLIKHVAIAATATAIISACPPGAIAGPFGQNIGELSPLKSRINHIIVIYQKTGASIRSTDNFPESTACRTGSTISRSGTKAPVIQTTFTLLHNHSTAARTFASRPATANRPCHSFPTTSLNSSPTPTPPATSSIASTMSNCKSTMACSKPAWAQWISSSLGATTPAWC
jgi:hypothetical protein